MNFIRRYKISSLLNTPLNSDDKRINDYFIKIFSNLKKYDYKKCLTFETYDTTIFMDNRGIIMFEYYKNNFHTRHNHHAVLKTLYKKEYTEILLFMLEKYLNIKNVLYISHGYNHSIILKEWRHVQREFKKDEKYFTDRPTDK